MENITITAATPELRSGEQAPTFYQKHGYEEYACVDDYAPDFYLAYMKKSLAR